MNIMSDQVANRKTRPPASPYSGGEHMVAQATLAVGTANVAAGQLWGLIVLPPETLPVDLHFYNEELDSGTSVLAVSVGVLNTLETDLIAGSNCFTGKVIGVPGMQRADVPDMFFKAATWRQQANAPQIHQPIVIAAKVTVAANVAASGAVFITCQYRPTAFGL
jgi:hypothetical protein